MLKSEQDPFVTWNKLIGSSINGLNLNGLISNVWRVCRKDLEFGHYHNQCLDFMPIKLQGHIKRSKVKYNDFISDFY